MVEVQGTGSFASDGESQSADLAGKYLTFALGTEHYGVEILKVVEIIGVMRITRVPRCPDYMKGVINLRGKIIPVIDLRMKFGMEGQAYDDKTCTIICRVRSGDQEMGVGMIVDTVLEVVDLEASKIEQAPDFGSSLDTRFILGMGKVSNTEVTILIDISRVLDQGDVEALAGAAAHTPS